MIRKIAAVTLAAGVMLGTAGCNMITHVASNDVYAPSDGAQATAGDVKARNFLLLEDGTKTLLIGSLAPSSVRRRFSRRILRLYGRVFESTEFNLKIR